jgi:hypothetical protein
MHVLALAAPLFEAFRRYQWVYIRFETEQRKLHAKNSTASISLLGNEAGSLPDSIVRKLG